ncbi:Oidioi.mRNA.OKI2018_I69.chr1.g664.t1.cds [Oikopleura dioica]|uniref:Oidioi.mRNA.OKI2018_I69.chr1.g664.t1.cds n=1 Tax=Oikopleura dioica TaxID=34765 RepID=A0ABN7SSQ7_OIKDI|nr:Oidioi.mRNA.OKI2018_I69.chr1.g664.t1.cds [Oikopleura dioica]
MPPRDEKIQVDQRKFEPGLATIPAQAYRKALKSGFRFNLMAIGEPSLGKTSTVNTIFKSEIYNEQFVSSTQRIANSDSLIVQEFDLKLKENGVPLILRVIDCPGYGAFIDNSNQVPTIVSYLDGRHRRQFDQEMDIDRDIEKNDDELVHCCLFFFSPNCRTVKELDLECLKAIHNKVNVIPIIAKADSLTLDERHELRKEILRVFEKNKISCYAFPENVDDSQAALIRKFVQKIVRKSEFFVKMENSTFNSIDIIDILSHLR